MRLDPVKAGGESLMHEGKANELINAVRSLTLLTASPIAIKLKISEDGTGAILELPVVKAVVCYRNESGEVVQKKALLVGVYDGDVPEGEEA
jgi:hypothetical protein